MKAVSIVLSLITFFFWPRETSPAKIEILQQISPQVKILIPDEKTFYN